MHELLTPTAPITANPEYQKIISENKLLRESLAERKRELASLKDNRGIESSQKTLSKATDTSGQVTIESNSMEDTLKQVMQQLQSMQSFQQQMFAEFQNLKSYADDSIASIRATVLKRPKSSPGAPSIRLPKQLPSSDSDSTIHGE